MSGTQAQNTADLTPEEVADFLDANRDFAREWFLSQDWLVTECLSKASSKTALTEEDIEEGDVASDSNDRNPIMSSMFDALVRGRRRKAPPKTRRRTKVELMGMNDKDLLMELIRDIANELDVDTLCHKILLNVSTLTRCDRGSLFLVGGNRDHKYLVSKLFDVTENSSLAASLHTPEKQFRVPFGKGIAGTVALTKEHINIHNAYEDPRFNQEVDKQTGFRTRNILCMPILNYEGEIMGVAQIMNKTDAEGFTAEDEKMFEDYLTFCGIGLANAQLFEMSVQEYRRNQMLLSLARGIFEEQGNMDGLVRRIMSETVTLIGVQRCCVYLIYDPVERESSEPLQLGLEKPKRKKNSTQQKEIIFSKAFQLQAGEEAEFVDLKTVDLDKSKCAKIAKNVAESGETTNSGNYVAYTDIGTESTANEIVEPDDFQVRSVLSLPIRDSEFKVIGVVQLMNKLNEKPFSDSDVNIVETFAIFCGLGIHNCQLYESACKMMAKQRVALEILSYHATAPDEETNKLKKQVIPTAQEYKLYSFEFNDFPLNDFETCKATVRMFLELGTINKYRIPYDVLCRWTLSVKKNYRAVTYHNWRHAFNVTQTMFTMLYTGKMSHLLGSLEMFSLLVACLSHDLDHRGTNNAFQNKVESPLAQLYSTSTMEHHHFDMCVMILNSEGNNIFMHLSPSEYRWAIKTVEAAIMATDLALYFKKRGGFEKLVNAGETKWESPEKRDLLRSMMMTACDVAAITKPWEIQRDVAQLVANEFFEQGDLERFKLHQEPIAMMDRQKKDELPSMQVGFIDSICIPVYKHLGKAFPALSPMVCGCLRNRAQWQSLAEEATANAFARPRKLLPYLLLKGFGEMQPRTKPLSYRPLALSSTRRFSYGGPTQPGRSFPFKPAMCPPPGACRWFRLRRCVVSIIARVASRCFRVVCRIPCIACIAGYLRHAKMKIFASIEPGLNPLLDGCQRNRDNWHSMAETGKQESDESKNESPPPENDTANDARPANTAEHPVVGDNVSSKTTASMPTESQENTAEVPLNNDVTSGQPPRRQNRPQTSYVINVTTANNRNDELKKSTNRLSTNVIMSEQTAKDNNALAADTKSDDSSKLCTLL